MKILITIIVGTITYLVIGYIVFELLLGRFTEANTLQLKGFNKLDEESSTPLLILSCAAYAVLITFILHNWRGNLSTIATFAVCGTIGSLIAIMVNTFLYSTTHFYKNVWPLIADIIAAYIAVGVMGVVIHYII